MGDSVYGRGKQFAPGTSEDLKKNISTFSRQALHAEQLKLVHPTSAKKVSYRAKIPDDLEQLIMLFHKS